MTQGFMIKILTGSSSLLADSKSYTDDDTTNTSKNEK